MKSVFSQNLFWLNKSTWLKTSDKSALCLNLFKFSLALNLFSCLWSIHAVLPQTWNLNREPLVWALDSFRPLVEGVFTSLAVIISPAMLVPFLIICALLAPRIRKLGIVDLCNLSKALAPAMSLPFWATYVTTHRTISKGQIFWYHDEWYTKVLLSLENLTASVLLLSAIYIILSPRWQGKRIPAIGVLALFFYIDCGIMLLSHMMTTNFWL